MEGNQVAPSTPVTPVGSTGSNLFGQRPDFTPSNPQEDIIVAPSSPAPKRHSIAKKVAILVGIILVTVLLGIFISRIASGGNTTKSDAYSALWDFYYDASFKSLIEQYDSRIGATPSLAIDDEYTYFPIGVYYLDRLQQQLESAEQGYDEFSKVESISDFSSAGKTSFSAVQSKTKSALADIRSNIEIIKSFYDAFAVPIYDLYNNEAAISCEQTDSISALIQDEHTGTAAEKYFTAYCEAISKHRGQTLEETTISAASDAVADLNELLSSVDNPQSEIEKLLEELSE